MYFILYSIHTMAICTGTQCLDTVFSALTIVTLGFLNVKMLLKSIRKKQKIKSEKTYNRISILIVVIA